MKSIKRIAVVLVIAIASVTSYSYVNHSFEVAKNLDIFATLFKELNIYYVDETSPGDLMKTGIDAMLESLDPYTVYIPESEIEDARFQMTGKYGGIGSLIRRKDDYVIIAEPYEGFPAHKAGLMAGDKILEVDGRPVKGKSTTELSKILKGEQGTEIKILIERPGAEETMEKTLVRSEVTINSVPYSGMLDDKTGYVKLTGFTRNAGKEVKEALSALKTNNPEMESFVFDLRENPGGLLMESVNICNLFIDRGEVVVSTKGKIKEWDKSYKALDSPMDKEMPFVVLVNSGSASASEIVSGTLQDLDRAVILGQKTYGKGLVQQPRPLSYDSQLKITTAKYYVPSGRCIQARDYSNRNADGSVGKMPDSLKTAFKTRNGRTVYDGGGIDPDITTDIHEYANITRSLVTKSLIFDYATTYRHKHESIADAKDFSITEDDYKAFIDFVSDKDYDYTTNSEKSLEDLKESAEDEKYFASIEAEYEALKNKMMHNKKEDLNTFKDEIVEFLEEEISSRYYYQKGRIETSMAHDPEIKRALEVLKDKTLYASILDGTYDPEKGN